MDSHDEQRFNNLQSAVWEGEQARKHLAAQISVLETVCLILSGQSTVKEPVLERLREVISVCGKANQTSLEPDSSWSFEEHYLRRFMVRVEDL